MNKDKYITKIISVIPLLLILGIMPLISYGKIDILSENIFLNWNGKNAEIDLFAYYKFIFTIIMTIMSILMLFIKKQKLVKDIPIYKFILIYTICIIISVILSEYKDMAINGFVFRYEGMIALIVYLLLLFMSINMFDNKDKIKSIFIVLIISSLVISIIAVFQYYNHDVFQNFNIQKSLIPKEHQYLAGKIVFSNADNSKVYSTLSNSNYLGSYFALILPIMITISILSKKYRKIFMPITVLNLFVLVASDSAAGVISVVAAFLILILMLRKKIMEEYKKGFLVLSCLIVVLGVFDFLSKGLIYTKTSSALNEFIYEVNVGKEKSKLEDIKLKDNLAEISFKDKVLNIESNNEQLFFRDGNNNLLSLKFDNQLKSWEFLENEYKDTIVEFVRLKESGKNIIKVDVDEDIHISLTTENDVFKYITHGGRIIEPKEVKYWWGDGKEELLTSRIYIWSRALPIILEKPLFGYGPDTFAAVFPQYDYVGLYKAYDTTNMIVDKPHNMYIQIAQSTGIISLFAFLGIVVLYIGKSFKIYIRYGNNDFYHIIGCAILMGVIGFLISGLFNDSVVFISPIFYILMGTGVRINYIIERNIDKEIQ
ncbi:O-antigen ligase family protein [Clostridioides difficile]